MIPAVVQIAVPTPLRRMFDYLPADGRHAEDYLVGTRVRVPFGRQQLVGVVMGFSPASDLPATRLKKIHATLDDQPVLPADILTLLQWASRYYHYPIGEVIQLGLPVLLRQGRPALPRRVLEWSLTPQGQQLNDDELAALGKRAPRQAALLSSISLAPGQRADADTLDREHTHWRAPLGRLQANGWVEKHERAQLLEPSGPEPDEPQSGHALNSDQRQAADAVNDKVDQFGRFLLDGVTGSGKTEVYLELIRGVVTKGRQALVLVPEIGLTPQLVQRFRQQLPCRIGVLHSGLSDQERLTVWLAARDGQLPVIIGTRSAVFTPLKSPGLFIVDEEHDLSFKQQDGFRYSARDLAVLRAQHAQVPVVLGSATPSLESLFNVQQQRMTRLTLPQRAGPAQPPRLHILDVRHQPMEAGLSPAMVQIVRQHLDRDRQVLLFLNRRGFAPTLLCHDCGWLAACPRCDSHLTLHRSVGRLRCHHCGTEQAVPRQCPACGNLDLRSIGAGTERIETELAGLFPQAEILRIDRDSTRRKGSLEDLLGRIQNGKRQILIGTQMLAKGHDFPNVTLVGILDADQGLYSADFRGAERMAQLIVQVAGRAGRAEHSGEVLIQTHHPDHPLLMQLTVQNYAACAAQLAEERQGAQLPPFSRLVLLRAESTAVDAPLAFLVQARQHAESLAVGGVVCFGPMPAPMEKRAGRFRAQLLAQADSSGPLQHLLSVWIPKLEGIKNKRQVRWSIDVDPQEMF